MKSNYNIDEFLTSLTQKCDNICEIENNKRNFDRKTREVFEMILAGVSLTNEVLDYMDDIVLEEILNIVDVGYQNPMANKMTSDMMLVEKSKDILKTSRTKKVPNTILLF